MPPELHNDQELVLKKRARRRLVGAIGLVLLMVIILPRILQDRAALAPQETVKISMPEANTVTHQEVAVAATPTSDATSVEAQMPAVDLLPSAEVVIPETPAGSESSQSINATADNSPNVAKNDNQSKALAPKAIVNTPEPKKVSPKVLDTKVLEAKIAAPKNAEPKANEPKTKEPKIADVKSSDLKALELKAAEHIGKFTIQVGVFSDIANVKQLQAKLKNAGLDSHTETINTDKGDKIRLKAGNFSSRESAVSALTKLQSVNLTGMVISND